MSKLFNNRHLFRTVQNSLIKWGKRSFSKIIHLYFRCLFSLFYLKLKNSVHFWRKIKMKLIIFSSSQKAGAWKTKVTNINYKWQRWRPLCWWRSIPEQTLLIKLNRSTLGSFASQKCKKEWIGDKGKMLNGIYWGCPPRPFAA